MMNLISADTALITHCPLHQLSSIGFFTAIFPISISMTGVTHQ